jgi:hypothetical protein
MREELGDIGAQLGAGKGALELGDDRRYRRGAVGA